MTQLIENKNSGLGLIAKENGFSKPEAKVPAQDRMEAPEYFGFLQGAARVRLQPFLLPASRKRAPE
jgi:hypothetical protein